MHMGLNTHGQPQKNTLKNWCFTYPNVTQSGVTLDSILDAQHSTGLKPINTNNSSRHNNSFSIWLLTLKCIRASKIKRKTRSLSLLSTPCGCFRGILANTFSHRQHTGPFNGLRVEWTNMLMRWQNVMQRRYIQFHAQINKRWKRKISSANVFHCCRTEQR